MYFSIIFFVATFCVINASVITVNVYDDDQHYVVESEDSLTLSSCNPKECDQRCRRLKFPGGVCVNGRCKCDNFRTSEDFASLIEEFNSLQKCYPQECEQRCRRLKFPGGACVNGRCKCDNFLTSEDIDNRPEDFKSSSNCISQDCNERCQRLGFSGGNCIKDDCVCKNTKIIEVFDLENWISKSCEDYLCDDWCRSHSNIGGICLRDICRCYVVNMHVNLVNIEDDIAENVEAISDPVDFLRKRICFPKKCNRLCKLRGSKDGTCVDGSCKCTKKEDPANTSPASALKDDQLYVVESEDSLSLSSCNPQECDQRCRRLKFPGGVCVHGRCKCDNFRTSEDFASLIEEFNSLQKCYPQECEQRCRRLKFPGGACVNGRCKCDNFRTSEDINSFSEDYKSLRNCISQDCNERCQRLGFAGGNCFIDFYRVCKKIIIREDDIVESVEAISELVESSKKPVCHPKKCNRLCQSRGSKEGTCVDGACKCTKKEDPTSTTPGSVPKEPNMLDAAAYYEFDDSNLIVNEDEGQTEDKSDDIVESVEAISEPVESSKKKVCHSKKCNRLCQSRGSKEGTCVDGACKCTKTEDPTSTTPASGPKEPNMPDAAAYYELDESDFVVNEDEGEIEDNSVEYERVTSQKCYQYKCNDSCIRVGYAGGLCNQNKCKCY